MSGFELGIKSRFAKKKFEVFWGFAAKKWTYVFVVHTLINKTFFRCKLCLQAYIFSDINDQRNISRCENDELEITKTANWVRLSF